MATQPKPKPRPEPEPPEPKPEEDDAANHGPIPTEASMLEQRLDALFTSHVALTERVEKLEERVNAPPIGLGKRP
jgi:hypothetical protein